MTFRTLALAAAALFIALAAALIVSPATVIASFQLENNTSAEVMARRAGALFLGASALLYGLRDLPRGDAQRAVSIGIMLMMGAVALLGMIEYAFGRTGPGVWLAIMIELAFAAGFYRHARQKPAAFQNHESGDDKLYKG